MVAGVSACYTNGAHVLPCLIIPIRPMQAKPSKEDHIDESSLWMRLGAKGDEYLVEPYTLLEPMVADVKVLRHAVLRFARCDWAARFAARWALMRCGVELMPRNQPCTLVLW